MNKVYEVEFRDYSGGGFAFIFEWDKKTIPTKKEILEVYNSDNEGSDDGWNRFLLYDTLTDLHLTNIEDVGKPIQEN